MRRFLLLTLLMVLVATSVAADDKELGFPQKQLAAIKSFFAGILQKKQDKVEDAIDAAGDKLKEAAAEKVQNIKQDIKEHVQEKVEQVKENVAERVENEQGGNTNDQQQQQDL